MKKFLGEAAQLIVIVAVIILIVFMVLIAAEMGMRMLEAWGRV